MDSFQFLFWENMVIVIIITIIIINIILIIIIIIAIICINIVNIGKISFTSLYIQLDKSLALTIGAEKELLFFGGVNYSVDEVLILPDCSSSSETQGQSVEPGEKAPRKFSSTGGRAPGYRLSSDHFHTVKWMLAPDWAQKMLCIIVPNRQPISRELFSWVRAQRVLCRHSCPVRSASIANQKRRNYRSLLSAGAI